MTRLIAFTLASLSLTSFAVTGCGAAPTGEETAATGEAVTFDEHRRSCESDSSCSVTEFCDTESSATCGGRGVCTSRGDTLACPYVDESLCGCNGDVYPNACLAHKAGVSIDPQPFKDEEIKATTLAKHPWMDAAETHFYLFTRSHAAGGSEKGTFQERTEPPCTRSNPHCDIAVEPLNGDFHVDGSTVELDYDNGQVAYFVSSIDCNKTWHLAGNDFGASETLTVSTITP